VSLFLIGVSHGSIHGALAAHPQTVIAAPPALLAIALGVVLEAFFGGVAVLITALELELVLDSFHARYRNTFNKCRKIIFGCPWANII
jgi:hypothetical protein